MLVQTTLFRSPWPSVPQSPSFPYRGFRVVTPISIYQRNIHTTPYIRNKVGTVGTESITMVETTFYPVPTLRTLSHVISRKPDIF